MRERRPRLRDDEDHHRQQQHDDATDQRAEPKLGALVLTESFFLVEEEKCVLYGHRRFMVLCAIPRDYLLNAGTAPAVDSTLPAALLVRAQVRNASTAGLGLVAGRTYQS